MTSFPALLAGFVFLSFAHIPAAVLADDQAQPLVSDSRIKTFVYNENEVYTILTQYGYQTSIEFSRSEKIETISVGDRVAWQIIPAGHRVFIQTLENDVRTNMTIVTDRRTYQFDLKSSKDIKNFENKLVYVARFYYPDETPKAMPAALAPIVPPHSMGTAQHHAPAPYAARAVPVAPVQASTPAGEEAANAFPVQENYNYTFSGDDALAPVKIYDDGVTTFFQFRPGLTPKIMLVGADGKEIALEVQPMGDMSMVQAVGAKFSIRDGNKVVCVFNEQFQ